ncbi:MAG: TIGR02281 family clan AA aspartic protease, partial [Cypionkella sp.]
MGEDRIASLIYLALLLAALGGWAMVEYRARMGQALRVAAAWGLIFLALAAGYGIWGNLRGDIMPRQSITAGSVTIPRAQDG